MKKCSNCGTEYEGNCCPNCGTWSEEERICPKCGNKMKAGANFCSNCGFTFGSAPDNKPQKNGGSSFKEKIAKVGKWMKKHLFIVIPVAVVLVVAIILACSIPACIKAKDNGTYYKLENGEIDRETYFVIDSGKWSDEDGESGTYKKDGDKIIFYIAFFGSTEEAAHGTIKDGVLTIGDDEYPDIYVSSSHKHNYGEWEMTKAPCTEDGTEERLCACGVKETRVIKCVGHHTGGEWLFDETSHYKICSVCKQEFNKGYHDATNYCSVCYYGTLDLDGLKFGLNSDKSGYCVIGVSNTAVKNINIPSTVKGLPVTSIGASAFEDCSSLTSVTIPDSVMYIGDNAFRSCDSLAEIKYEGSIEDWCQIKGLKNLMARGTADRKLIINNIEIKGKLIIPNGVTSIGDGAFIGCSSLINITIPDSVTGIGWHAFSDCSSLTSITIPDSVTSIGNGAFGRCNSLTNIIFSNSVKYIDDDAFIGCSSLTSITFEGTKAQWNAIEKGSNWNMNTGNYIIHCTDGDIKK